MTRIYGPQEQAVAAALHRLDLPECEPDTDDYSDEAEHLLYAADLLDSLYAHGWALTPRGSRGGAVESFSSALANLGGPASESA